MPAWVTQNTFLQTQINKKNKNQMSGIGLDGKELLLDEKVQKERA